MRAVEILIVGYSVLSYLIAALAWLGAASGPSIFFASVATGAGAALLLRQRLPRGRSGQEVTRDPTPLWMLAAGLVPLVHVLAVPPYMRDDLIYHLAVPSRIARTGGFLFDPHNVNANLPMLFEMPLVITESLGGFVSPFVANLAVLLALEVVFFVMARDLFGTGRRVAVLGAITAAYTPVIYDLAHSCYVELFFALLIMLAFRRYLLFREDRCCRSHWWGTMMFLGWACATKYFGLLYIAFVAALEFVAWRGPRRYYYLGVILALSLACPWYVRNWALLGNPVFPLLSFLFPSPYLSAARAYQFSRLAANYHDGKAIVDWLLLPVKLVAGWNPAPVVGRLGFDGRLGLFFVIAVLGLRFTTSRQRILAALLATYAVFWAITSQQVRFLLPPVLLASLSGLQLLDSLLRKRRICLAILAIVLVQDLYWIARQAHEQKIVALLTRRISREQFLHYHAPVSYTMAAAINRSLDPSRHRILTVGTYGRDYYFRVPVVSHTYYDTEYFDRAFARDSLRPETIESFLRAERITHILFDWGYYTGLVHPTSELVDTESLRRWLRSKSRVVLRQGGVELLELQQERGSTIGSLGTHGAAHCGVPDCGRALGDSSWQLRAEDRGGASTTATAHTPSGPPCLRSEPHRCPSPRGS